MPPSYNSIVRQLLKLRLSLFPRIFGVAYSVYNVYLCSRRNNI